MVSQLVHGLREDMRPCVRLSERYQSILNSGECQIRGHGELAAAANELDRQIREICQPIAEAMLSIKESTTAKFTDLPLQRRQLQPQGIGKFFTLSDEFNRDFAATRARVKVLSDCLRLKSNPRTLFLANTGGADVAATSGLGEKSLVAGVKAWLVAKVDQIRWSTSKNYRNSRLSEVESELKEANDRIASLISSDLKGLAEQVNSTVATWNSSNIGNIWSLSTAKEVAERASVIKDHFQKLAYFGHCQRLAVELLSSLADPQMRSLAEMQLNAIGAKLQSAWENAAQVGNALIGNWFGATQERGIAKILTDGIIKLSNELYVKNSLSGYEERFDAVEALPSGDDINCVNRTLGAISQFIETGKALWSMFRARSHSIPDILQNDLLRRANGFTEAIKSYDDSCKTLDKSLVSHCTRDSLAKEIIRSGEIRSSLYQQETSGKPNVNSPLGTTQPLPAVALSVNGVEFHYGGASQTANGSDGVVVHSPLISAAARGSPISPESQVANSAIAFVFNFADAVRGSRFCLGVNTQGSAAGRHPELHIFSKNYSKSTPVGACLPLNDVRILMPESKKAEWREFLLKRFEDGGAGKDEAWISKHVVFYEGDIRQGLWFMRLQRLQQDDGFNASGHNSTGYYVPIAGTNPSPWVGADSLYEWH